MKAPTSSFDIDFVLTGTGSIVKTQDATGNGHRQPPVLADAARRAVEWLLTWPSRRAATRELASLTDRELADIGLSRQEIREAVSQH